ncbi:hypothetical protein DKM19_00425 [Streptosporangium sp. 'caverna']|nr:hypothetical protein DKM19_00425 [Streptosporangium sp. 'caverna']
MEGNTLVMRVPNCQAAQPDAWVTVSGPAINRWVETVCRVAKTFERAAPPKDPPDDEKRIRRTVRKLLSFLSRSFFWPVAAGLVVLLLAIWLGLR